MGIHGLLQLEDIDSATTLITDLKGQLGYQVAAVDGHSWIHMGCYGCGTAIYFNEAGADAYIQYFMSSIQILLDHRIIPFVVFDGMRLEAKEDTDAKRIQDKNKNKERIQELLSQNNVSEARRKCKQYVEVTQTMVRNVIKELRQKDIPYLVSPYESDAQMAYLESKGHVDFIITEDSDLIVYGAKRILYKFQKEKKLFEASKVTSDFRDLDFLRKTCILSGCDYLSNLPKIGLKTAIKFMRMFYDRPSQSSASSSYPSSSSGLKIDLASYLKQLPKILNLKHLNSVPDVYIKKFFDADLVFKHQVVYCPKEHRMVPLTPYEKGSSLSYLDLPFAGKFLSPDLSFQHSLGNLDFDTLEKIDYNDGFKPKKNWLENVRKTHEYLISPSLFPESPESTPKSSPASTSSSYFSSSSKLHLVSSSKRCASNIDTKTAEMMKKLRKMGSSSGCPYKNIMSSTSLVLPHSTRYSHSTTPPKNVVKQKDVVHSGQSNYDPHPDNYGCGDEESSVTASTHDKPVASNKKRHNCDDVSGTTASTSMIHKEYDVNEVKHHRYDDNQQQHLQTSRVTMISSSDDRMTQSSSLSSSTSSCESLSCGGISSQDSVIIVYDAPVADKQENKNEKRMPGGKTSDTRQELSLSSPLSGPASNGSLSSSSSSCFSHPRETFEKFKKSCLTPSTPRLKRNSFGSDEKTVSSHYFSEQQTATTPESGRKSSFYQKIMSSAATESPDADRPFEEYFAECFADTNSYSSSSGESLSGTESGYGSQS